MLKVGVISLFPEMFAALDYGIPGRAQQNNLVDIQYFNPRDFSQDKHRNVDDKPYGGGPGMVMQIQPLQDALQEAKQTLGPQSKVLFLSPKGDKFNQQAAQQLASQQNLIFVAGRYEGVDQRFIEQFVDEQWSVGDYVLSGGEFAAMTMLDTVIRLLPKALGDAESALQDSFSDGLLDYPHYTRPDDYQGLQVPKVLLAGDHKAIAKWRRQQALGQTWLKRPDLLAQQQLTAADQELLDEFIKTYKSTI